MKRDLTELFLQKLQPQPRRFLVWDGKQRGLALAVRPNNRRSWKCIYSVRGRVRWYTIGPADVISLAEARKRAAKIRVAVADGKDPQAEKRAERGVGTFAELARRYVEEYAKGRNKSWAQADYLVRSHLLPRWGKLLPSNITRDDVKRLKAAIKAPIVANQTLAAASAIFSWAMREQIGGVAVNPCRHVERHATHSRERVLAASEVAPLWTALGKAGEAGKVLKLILLTGQRPGEVSAMRREHIRDGWWEMPGEPSGDWPGTKNGRSHRVWLPQPATLLATNNVPSVTPTERVIDFDNVPSVAQLAATMRTICTQLGVTQKVTPHDLRRTFLSQVTALGFGRDALDRIANHKKQHAVTDVYDRHGYASEDQHIMEAVAAEIVRLAEGRPGAGQGRAPEGSDARAVLAGGAGVLRASRPPSQPWIRGAGRKRGG
jgi:integrase